MSLGSWSGPDLDLGNLNSDWDASGHILIESIDENVRTSEVIVDVQIAVRCFPLVESVKIAMNVGANQADNHAWISLVDLIYLVTH